MGKELSVDKKTKLDPDEVAIPCGIAAYTYFNDSFELKNKSTTLKILDTDIAWDTDKDKFKNGDLSK